VVMRLPLSEMYETWIAKLPANAKIFRYSKYDVLVSDSGKIRSTLKLFVVGSLYSSSIDVFPVYKERLIDSRCGDVTKSYGLREY